MVLHLRVTCDDLKIYIINDSEHGSSGFRFHLYDHLSVSPDIAVGMDAPWKDRVQGSLSIL